MELIILLVNFTSIVYNCEFMHLNNFADVMLFNLKLCKRQGMFKNCLLRVALVLYEGQNGRGSLRIHKTIKRG